MIRVTYTFVNALPEVKVLTGAMGLSGGILLYSCDASLIGGPILPTACSTIGDHVSNCFDRIASHSVWYLSS